MKQASVIRASLDQSIISTGLPSNYWRVRVVAKVDSTQVLLKNQLVSTGDCVVAEFQSAGRGRLERKFDAASGTALLFSFYIEPTRATQWGWIPLLAGIAVAQTLNEETHSITYKTKWPNDVIADSGKICGILCERYGRGIIVGIGINVSTEPAELPVPTASSIFIESGVELDRNILLPTLLNNFSEIFARWNSGEDLKSKYRALSQTIGSEVSVLLPDGLSRNGRAIGVDSEGQLILENGELISVGDVLHLR